MENIYNKNKKYYNYVYFKTSMKGGDKVGKWLQKKSTLQETKSKHLTYDIEKLKDSFRDIKGNKGNT